MQKLQTLPTRPASNPIFIFFLRDDAVLEPLTTHFRPLTIVQNGKESLVSVDRLKPAYLNRLVFKNAISVFPTDPPVKKKVENRCQLLAMEDMHFSQIVAKLKSG